MKKIISCFLILSFILCFAGCKEPAASSEVTSSEPAEVITPQKTQSGIEDRVRALGRTVISTEGIWTSWSGSGVEFSFVGSSAKAVLWASLVFGEGNEMLMGVFVDGEAEPSATLTVSDEKTEHILCEKLKEGTHTLKLIKLTEAQYGSVCIEDVSAGQMSPTSPKKLTFEFIGDSIVCGNGVLAKSSRGDFTTTQQDVSKTLGYLLSNEYSADSRYIAATGYGVDRASSGGKQIAELYAKTSPFLKDQTGIDAGEWEFSDPADMVFVNISTDRAQYITDEAGRNAFQAETVNLIKTLREKNPNAEIFLLCGTASYVLQTQLERVYNELKTDTKLHYFAFSFTSKAVYSGISAGYPSAHSNTRMLKELKKEMKKLGFDPKEMK